jgi:hypothetical protein
MARIIITNNVETAKTIKPSVTVEAEYGSFTIKGSKATLAHHGVNSDNPCPCLGRNLSLNFGSDEVILVSHFDLDTLGGVMRSLNLKDWDEEEGEDLFWRAAALVDTVGPHKLDTEIRASLWKEYTKGISMGSEEFNQADYEFESIWEITRSEFNAFWAWSEAHRLFPPRDGSAADVTEFFFEAIETINLIIGSAEPSLMEAGVKWAESKQQLNEDSFQGVFPGGLIVRVSEAFTNHLYETPEGEPMVAVIALNEKFGSVTLSVADPIEGFSIGEFVKTLWGPEAGGHAVIGGSPRGTQYSKNDLEKAAESFSKALLKALA